MGRSRRKYKKSRPKVKVGLPRKNHRIVKPSFNLHPKFIRSFIDQRDDAPAPEWDNQGTVMDNYGTFGVVSDPNVQLAEPADVGPYADTVDTGSDLEEDDLKSALGKKRRDGKSAPPQPLTAMQRLHIHRLVEKYGDDYQRMFMDTKLNSLQHSVATLEKLCKRFHIHRDKNPLIVSRLFKVDALYIQPVSLSTGEDLMENTTDHPINHRRSRRKQPVNSQAFSKQ